MFPAWVEVRFRRQGNKIFGNVSWCSDSTAALLSHLLRLQHDLNSAHISVNSHIQNKDLEKKKVCSISQELSPLSVENNFQ